MNPFRSIALFITCPGALRFLGSCGVWMCSFISACAFSEQDLTDKLARSFIASRPTISMEYDVNYRIMGLRLMRIAHARLEVTEGLWKLPGGGDALSCFLVQVRLQSTRCDEETKEKGRIYINDYVLSVSERPSLKTLYYVKKTDEMIHPPLARAKQVDKVVVYNMECDSLDYYACDYLTGTIHTNLTGVADMASKGSEVSRILNEMSDVFHNKSEPITPESAFRLHVNYDGVAIPFAAQTHAETLHILGEKWPVLQVEVMPAAEAPEIDSHSFRMWATSLKQLADTLHNPTLQEVAADNPPWDMIPLVADYELIFGSIRCSVRSVQDAVWQ